MCRITNQRKMLTPYYLCDGTHTHPPPNIDEYDLPSPNRSGALERVGDNNDGGVMPIALVEVVVKNGNNVENTSTAWDDDVPIIMFNREKDGDATTRAAARVCHAKGNKLVSKSGLGSEAKGGGGGVAI